MGKNKNTELNFLYLDDKYSNNNKKKKTKKAVSKNVKKKSNKNSKNTYNDVFDFDNEIVIGVTKTEPKETKKLKNKAQKKATAKIKPSNSNKHKKQISKAKGAEKKSAPSNNIKKNAKKMDKPPKEKKNTVGIKIAKWTILMLSLGIAFICFLLSPIFNIKEIVVTGNEKISTETIISLSQIQIEENIFKMMRKTIIKNIKQEPYIGKVEVIRKLPSTIELEITERKATFMLEYAGSYAYISNQGYILEINQNPINTPIIVGYSTTEDEIQVGKRLIKDDLDKLENVLKIVEALHSNEIQEDVSRINISDKDDYKLTMDGEKKIVHLGDVSNLSNRMLYLKVALQDTKGLEGEIFINGDLNKDKAYFRQTI